VCVEYEGWKGEVRGEITWNRFRGTKEKFGGFKVTVLFLVIERRDYMESVQGNKGKVRGF